MKYDKKKKFNIGSLPADMETGSKVMILAEMLSSADDLSKLLESKLLAMHHNISEKTDTFVS